MMRRLLFALALLVLAAIPHAQAQEVSGDSNAGSCSGCNNINTSPLLESILNDPTIGSTTNTVSKLLSTGAEISGTTDLSNAIGICNSQCGTTGNGLFAVGGQQSCVFDGSTTRGDFVVVSTTVAGDCHDSGSGTVVPQNVQILGTALATNVGAGTYVVDLDNVGVMGAITNNTGVLGTGPLTETIINDTVTGTTQFTVSKLISTGARKSTTSAADQTNAIGICAAQCGNTGSAQIAINGQVSCIFDNGATFGDFVTLSTTVAGDCHDAGTTLPAAVQVLGFALTTHAGAGTYTVDMNNVGVEGAQVNRGTVLNGTAGSLGYYATTGTTISPLPGSNVSGVQGNGAKVQLSTGTTTNGDCAKYDANGNVIDAGAACGTVTAVTVTAPITGGGSSGSVNIACGTCARTDTADQTLSGGFNITSQNLGTPTNGSTTTIDCGSRDLQYLTNNVAGITIAAPSNDGKCDVLVINGASAGTVTLSGFCSPTNPGDAFDTVNGHMVTIGIWRINGNACYRLAAHY